MSDSTQEELHYPKEKESVYGIENIPEPSEIKNESEKPLIHHTEIDFKPEMPEDSDFRESNLDQDQHTEESFISQIHPKVEIESNEFHPELISSIKEEEIPEGNTIPSIATIQPTPAKPAIKKDEDILEKEMKDVPSSKEELTPLIKLAEMKEHSLTRSNIIQALIVFLAILFALLFSSRGRKSSSFKTIKGAGEGLEDAKLIRVNSERLIDEIEKLSKFSDHDPPSVTRIVFSDNDIEARKFIKSLMEDAGLEIREDAVGNIFGKWEGKRTDLSSVLTGSHTDAIPHAGKYDGVLGVLGGIEAIRALKEIGFVPKRSIEVLMFTSEEPTRFGYGCIGSRLMSNQKGFKDKILSVKDKDGLSFSEAAGHAGYSNVEGEIKNVILSSSLYSSFVELHIEQGAFLERKGIQIGIVTHIAAPSTLNVAFHGHGGHAGGLLMKERNDAGLAGAELALAVESHVLNLGSNDTVGTTGSFQIFPGAVNSVPREAKLGIDVRDIDEKRKDRVVNAIMQSAKSIAKRRKVELSECMVVNSDPPAEAGPLVRDAIRHSVKELGFSSMPIISRAYHDSLFMSRIAPTGMIFIPCYKGYSHRPDEFASKADIENGVRVLALTLAKLSLQ